jgi:hypothetical protein
MNELKEHPQVAELIDTLDKNDMHKEKAEVESLVDYIGDMEKTLTEMLKEMQDMRQEINLIHNNTLRVKCQNLVEKTEGKIKQGFALLGKVKDNIVQSAKNALKAFKERGKEALRSAVKAMKISETLDKLGSFFGKLSKEVEQDVQQLNSMQSELNSSKGHLKNIGRLLIGRETKKVEQAKSDKGVFSRFGKLLEKIGKGFGTLSQKAMDKADKIRVTNVKESVKNELDTLKNLNHGRSVSDPSRER